MKGVTITMGAVAVAAITGMADAGIIFFTDEAAFNQALADAGKVSKGIEDFEQALIGPVEALLMNDPLNINNLQGAFKPGDFIDNLTFQSNTNGTPDINDPGVNGLNPRGVDGLRLVRDPDGSVGLVSALESDSFDILSGPPAGGNHTALGMHVDTYIAAGPPIEVRVFDKNERQIGLISIFPNPPAGQFLGIPATGGDTIGRVNIWDTLGPLQEGINDIQTYLIPAPGAWALLGLAGLFGPWRRRR